VIDNFDPGSPERRAAYAADITYGTNNEFGFDYLRDNMVHTLEQRVQRGHHYAIIVLADLLRSAARQTQVIVSTQSVPLVNQFVAEDIIVVDRKDDQSTFERRSSHDLANWLDDYGVGDLWEKNLLGGRPR